MPASSAASKYSGTSVCVCSLTKLKPAARVGRRDSSLGALALDLGADRQLCARRHAAHRNVNPCQPSVEIALHPRVVDVCLRRGLKLNVSNDAAPALAAACQTVAVRDDIVGDYDDLGRLAGLQEIRHVVLPGACIHVEKPNWIVVHIEPPAGTHAAYLQPYAAPLPAGRHVYAAAV